MKETNLKEVEKKTYMSYHQDGLIDILVGIYVLMFGSGILFLTLTDFSTLFVVIPAIFPAIMIPVWISAKKRITMPRIGYVKFRSRGAYRLMAVFLGLMVFGLGTFMAFTFASSQGWALTLRNLVVLNGMIIIGVAAATISSLFAYTMGLKRLYAYGLLTLVLFLIGHFITIPFGYFLVTIGLVIIITGFVLLMRFIRKYPITQGDKKNAEKSL
ncbi:MAG: hypothetical protein OEY88_08870 [Candidatus Bathyarchaeota archaeon]|nr:hypothetical protein [Candidatus Bathyarchaeota archaeon]